MHRLPRHATQVGVEVAEVEEKEEEDRAATAGACETRSKANSRLLIKRW